jgi:hypothetical protein
MTDIGPSLSKLRRDWQESGEVVAPQGMISRRILNAMADKLAEGEQLVVTRIDARTLRITLSHTGRGE